MKNLFIKLGFAIYFVVVVNIVVLAVAGIVALIGLGFQKIKLIENQMLENIAGLSLFSLCICMIFGVIAFIAHQVKI